MTRGARSITSRLLFLLTSAPLWSGCAALGTLETADTVPRGQTRMTVQGWVQGVDDGEKPDALPQVAVSGRIGVAEGFDVGGRLSPQGVEGSMKLVLVGRDEGAWWVMSVAPTAGAVLLSQAWEGSDVKTQLYGALPLLMAVRNPEDGSQLVLGLRPTWMRFDQLGDSEVRYVLGMGGSLGYAFRVHSGLRVMPELALLMPVVERERGPWVRMDGKPVLQFGVALLIDSVR